MDIVELPLPAPVVMRSSGCGGGGVDVGVGGGVTISSFHSPKGNKCNVNGSRPTFWNKISDIDLHRQSSQLSSLVNEEDMNSKQSPRKSGKTSRSNGYCSRRSRVAHMEASINATGSLDVNGSPKELGSYPGKCNISEKIQTAKQKTVSVKRSEKRNSKISKTGQCDSFSLKAGLSTFTSSGGANNIFDAYGLKQENCADILKHIDDLSLNELLDGSYKSPQSVKVKGNNTPSSNENILQLVRNASSVLQLRKSTQPPSMPIADTTIHQNDNSNKKLEKLLEPQDIMARLSLSSSKDLDLLLLDTMKPSTSKGNVDPRLGKSVNNRSGLPSFPWSHISGGHFKASPDVVKLNPNKTTCQSRWVKMGNPITSFGNAATYLVDLGSFVYDQSLVQIKCKQPDVNNNNNNNNITPGHAPGVLAAAQTLCEIATRFQNVRQEKPLQKNSTRCTKLKSDEKLEKTLFMSENGGMKRPLTTSITATRLSNRPSKIRKLVPMAWRSPVNDNRSACDGRY